MPELPTPSRSQRLRSGLFALLVAPTALSVLSAGVVGVISVTAVGEPMSSSVGSIGMLVGAVLIALIAVNCEETLAGMVVTTAISFALGVVQMFGYSPGTNFMGVTPEEVSSVMRWSLYPMAVSALLGSVTIAMFLVRHRELRRARRRWGAGEPILPTGGARLADSTPTHRRERSFVAAATLIATCVLVTLLVEVAPTNTATVAARGLSSVTDITPTSVLHGLLVLACAMTIGLTTRWSVLGSQIVAWVLLVIPFFLALPLWASLTGNVVTPGDSMNTAFQMAAPVAAALGLVLGASSMGVMWTRRHTRIMLAASVDGADTPTDDASATSGVPGTSTSDGTPTDEAGATATDGGAAPAPTA